MARFRLIGLHLACFWLAWFGQVYAQSKKVFSDIGLVGLVWLDLAVFLWFGLPWLGLAGFRGSPVAWFGLACLVCLVLFGWVRLNVALFPLVWFGWIWRFSVGFVGFGFVLVCSRVSARACALVGLIWLYLVGFGLIWLDLAEFGWIWLDLAWLGWIWLGFDLF